MPLPRVEGRAAAWFWLWLALDASHGNRDLARGVRRGFGQADAEHAVLKAGSDRLTIDNAGEAQAAAELAGAALVDEQAAILLAAAPGWSRR